MSDWQTKKIKSPQTYRKKNKVKRNISSRGIGKWLVSAFVLIIIFYILSFLLPRVDIMIIPESRLVEFNDKITIVINAREEENVDKILSGKKVFSSGKINEIFTATGEKDIGDKASGEVTFFNYTGLSQPVMVEDGLETFDGKFFTISSPLTIPAATVSPDGDIMAGQVTMKVIALNAGDAHNINPQKLFIKSVPPEKQLKIYGESQAVFTGGTSEIIEVISEDDVKEAQEKLREALTDKILLQISEDLPDDQTFMRETFKLADEAFASEVVIDQETEEFNYELSAKGEVIIYENEKLNELIKYNLSSKLLPGEIFLSDEPQQIEIKEVALDSLNNTAIKILASWPVSQPVNLEEFAEQVLGLREADARRIILQHEAVADVRFDWNFAINRRVPNVASHVNLSIGISN